MKEGARRIRELCSVGKSQDLSTANAQRSARSPLKMTRDESFCGGAQGPTLSKRMMWYGDVAPFQDDRRCYARMNYSRLRTPILSSSSCRSLTGVGASIIK